MRPHGRGSVLNVEGERMVEQRERMIRYCMTELALKARGDIEHPDYTEADAALLLDEIRRLRRKAGESVTDDEPREQTMPKTETRYIPIPEGLRLPAKTGARLTSDGRYELLSGGEPADTCQVESAAPRSSPHDLHEP
jgi:hypothetical protein